MQSYSNNGYSLGYRTKSYSSIASKISKTQLKKEISYSQHKKRTKENLNANPYVKLRIDINKFRNSIGYQPFLKQDEFEEIIECVDFTNLELINFLQTIGFFLVPIVSVEIYTRI